MGDGRAELRLAEQVPERAKKLGERNGCGSVPQNCMNVHAYLVKKCV